MPLDGVELAGLDLVSRPLVSFVSIAVASVLCSLAAPAFAGDLDRIETAHKDKGSGSESSSSAPAHSSKKRSHGGDAAADVVGGILSALVAPSSEGGAEEGAPSVPAHGLAMDSYAEDRSSAYAVNVGPDKRMIRYGELSLSGFSAFAPQVSALDAQMNLFLGAFTMHAAVTRYYEPESQNLQTLDLLRLQVGLNVLHGWVNNAELHVTGGVLGLHGNDWTPGGSVRTDLRVYPFRPFTVDVVGDASFFPHGPPLVEAQLLPGATFARLDLRLGAGLLFQPGVAPILGPRVQVGIRF